MWRYPSACAVAKRQSIEDRPATQMSISNVVLVDFRDKLPFITDARIFRTKTPYKAINAYAYSVMMMMMMVMTLVT